MYRELTEEEIQKFTKKYLPIWNEDIKKVSCISYRLTKEYLINGHYFVIVKPFKIIKKDLQDL